MTELIISGFLDFGNFEGEGSDFNSALQDLKKQIINYYSDGECTFTGLKSIESDDGIVDVDLDAINDELDVIINHNVRAVEQYYEGMKDIELEYKSNLI